MTTRWHIDHGQILVVGRDECFDCGQGTITYSQNDDYCFESCNHCDYENIAERENPTGE